MSDPNRRDILALGGLLALHSTAGEVAWAQSDPSEQRAPPERRTPSETNDPSRMSSRVETSAPNIVGEQNGLRSTNDPARVIMRGEFRGPSDTFGTKVRGPRLSDMDSFHSRATGTERPSSYLGSEFHEYSAPSWRQSFEGEAKQYFDKALANLRECTVYGLRDSDRKLEENSRLAEAAEKALAHYYTAPLLEGPKELFDYWNSKAESLDLSRGPEQFGPAIEAYRLPIVPYIPYSDPFDYPNPATGPWDASEGRWPGFIPLGWTGASEYGPSVIPQQWQTPPWGWGAAGR